MNFLKKIGGIFSKMTSRRNEKLLEAISQKPKHQQDSIQDIEDLVKTKYSSPFQTRSQRMKQNKIKAVASLTPGTPANLKLKAIPLLQSGNLIKINQDHNMKNTSRKQITIPDSKPGMSLASETAAPMHVSQTHSLGMITVPSKKTMLAEFYHPMSEIDNKIRQSFDSEYGKSVQFTLVPSSDSNDVESENVKIDAKAVRKKKVETSSMLNDNALSKSEELIQSAVVEKKPTAKSKRMPKSLTGAQEKKEATKKEATVKKAESIENVKEGRVKKQKTVNKKKLTKKEAKEKNKTELAEDKGLSSDESTSINCLLGQELMPVPPKRPTKAKRTDKLKQFLYSPHQISTNTKVLNVKDRFVDVREEPKGKRKVSMTNSKPSLMEFSDLEPVMKYEKWQPKKWQVALENIKLMRSFEEAPVDRMGCQKCYDEKADEKTQRFQLLVALMLSSQTRDQVTYQVMRALRELPCTPLSIATMDRESLLEILHPVSFYKSKTKYLQNTAKILMEQYDSDIPKNVNELIKLPGVGPKMAHICMGVAWDLITGIGVDTHVHRISNRLGWVPKPTKEPEQTRKQLELWLPSEHWRDMNYLLVGFGQTFCTPVKPKCHQCLNNAFCPSANIMQRVKKQEQECADE